jgi:hypothetical protein
MEFNKVTTAVIVNDLSDHFNNFIQLSSLNSAKKMLPNQLTSLALKTIDALNMPYTVNFP